MWSDGFTLSRRQIINAKRRMARYFIRRRRHQSSKWLTGFDASIRPWKRRKFPWINSERGCGSRARKRSGNLKLARIAKVLRRKHP